MIYHNIVREWFVTFGSRHMLYKRESTGSIHQNSVSMEHGENFAQHYSDEDVLARSRSEPWLFGVLLDRYQNAFLRKAENVLKNREDAEDTVQETFTKIYLYAERFEKQDGASFKSWGYKILLNTAFTKYQKKKREREGTATLDPEFYEMLPDTAMRQFERHELLEYVVSILARMPDALSGVLRSHLLDGMPQKDIAKREGVSVGTIKTRVHRAKKSFKEISEHLHTSIA